MTIEEIRQKEIAYCRTRPEYFVETYCHIEDKDAAEIVVPFHLWPAQRDALRAMHDNRLNIVLKARQLGVTWLALAYAAHVMITTPGATVIALSRTEEEAKELSRRMGVIFWNMPELVGAVDVRTLGVTLGGVRQSTFKAFPSASGAGRSFTANLLILDEWAFQANAREIWLSTYPTINRPTGGKVIGLSTIERGTLFEELFTQENNFHKIFLPWSADPRRTPEWYERTRADLGELVMQEYPATVAEALTIPGGAYFPEFKTFSHVVEPFPIPEHWMRYRAIDYGLDMLACVWAAFDEQGNGYIYNELHEPNLVISEAARKINERTAQGVRCTYAPADMWGRNRDSGKAQADLFAEYGLPLARVKNPRIDGWLNLKEWFKGDVPRLKVFANCANLIRCITMIQRDERDASDCATEPHALTHMPDALRYLMDGRPRPAEIPTQRDELTFDDQIDNFMQYGR